MRKLALGLCLAACTGAAAAGGDAWTDAGYAEGDDYSARLFYRLDFGGPVGHARAGSVGLRLDHERSAARGAPALFQAGFDGATPTLRLQGVELAGPALAAAQNEGGGMFSGWTAANWLAFGFTAIVFGTVISEAADSADEPTTVGGTGTGGG